MTYQELGAQSSINLTGIVIMKAEHQHIVDEMHQVWVFLVYSDN